MSEITLQIEKIEKLHLAAGMEPYKILPSIHEMLIYRSIVAKEALNNQSIDMAIQYEDLLNYINTQIKRILGL